MTLQNIEFWGLQHVMIELSDPGTFQAQSVYPTFEDQNNGDKVDRNKQEATGYPVLCPVRSAAALVRNTLRPPGKNLDMPVCSVMKEVTVR